MNNFKLVYLIFKPGTGRYPFLKKMCGHVFALEWDFSNKQYIKIDPKHSDLDIKIFKSDILKFYKENGYMILKIELIKSKKTHKPKFLKPLSCVSIIKYYLNYNCFAFTPWQLFKKLNRIESIESDDFSMAVTRVLL